MEMKEPGYKKKKKERSVSQMLSLTYKLPADYDLA
jgi:hypothetical protein